MTDTDPALEPYQPRKRRGGYAPDFVDDMRTLYFVAEEMEKENRPPVEIDAIQNLAYWSGHILHATDGRSDRQAELDKSFQGLNARQCRDLWRGWLNYWYIDQTLLQEVQGRFVAYEAENKEMLKQGRAELLARLEGERGEG